MPQTGCSWFWVWNKTHCVVLSVFAEAAVVEPVNYIEFSGKNTTPKGIVFTGID
jgi:hypothetical protein